MARKDDRIRYEELLESTKNGDGVRHRDQAVKLLAEELLESSDRLSEFAEAQARKIAEDFDRSHQPVTDEGQMTLFESSYLVIGDNERVPVTEAKSHHARQWLDILAMNQARVAAAWAAKDQRTRQLLRVMDERKCSMWEAEMFLRGEIA